MTQSTPVETSAAQRWSDALAAWAIPEEILAAAPVSPWEFEPSLYARAAARAQAGERSGPSLDRALELLPAGGSVVDVGVGGGAASLPLAPPAGLIIGVDESRPLLDTFAAAADARGVAHREVQGTWPAAAQDVEPADVVVCHHVLYNVAELGPFALALTDHARRRVVVELTARHPMTSTNALWKAIHGIDRPNRPVWSDAVEVLNEVGLDVTHVLFERRPQGPAMARAEAVAHHRRRLCVGPERDAEIDALLPDDVLDPIRTICVIWWDGSA